MCHPNLLQSAEQGPCHLSSTWNHRKKRRPPHERVHQLHNACTNHVHPLTPEHSPFEGLVSAASKRKPDGAVYGIIERLGHEKAFWSRIGVAFRNRDGSIDLLLDFFPRDPGTGLQVRWAEEEENQHTSSARACRDRKGPGRRGGVVKGSSRKGRGAFKEFRPGGVRRSRTSRGSRRARARSRP